MSPLELQLRMGVVFYVNSFQAREPRWRNSYQPEPPEDDEPSSDSDNEENTSEGVTKQESLEPYYKLLDLTEGASVDGINRAFRAKSLIYHPGIY